MRVFTPALIAAALAVAPQSTQQPPVFRSGVDLVRFDVRVTDGNGRPITDIRPEEKQYLLVPCVLLPTGADELRLGRPRGGGDHEHREPHHRDAVAAPHAPDYAADDEIGLRTGGTARVMRAARRRSGRRSASTIRARAASASSSVSVRSGAWKTRCTATDFLPSPTWSPW